MAGITRPLRNLEHLLALSDSEQEDQWHRKNTVQLLQLDSRVFGFPLQVLSNESRILDACKLALTRFTLGPDRPGERPIQLHLFVREADRDPTEDALEEFGDGRGHFQYDGFQDYAAIDFGAHGHCAIHLQDRTATAFLSDALSQRTELVARFVISTALLNILTRCELVQWHAASLVRGSKVLMLVGTDNSGKSATALTLLMSGYRILGESLTYSRQVGASFELMGFPVGHLRLRPHGMTRFPQWRDVGHLLSSNEGQKWLLDLDKIMPAQVLTESLVTSNLILMFVAVGANDDTTLRQLTDGEALERAVAACSLWEGAQRMDHILAKVNNTIRQVPSYELLVGQSQDRIVQVVDSLMEGE